MLVIILVVFGYIILTAGSVLFCLAVVKKLVDSGPSHVKILGVEVSFPGTLAMAVLGGALVLAGTFGPILVGGTAPANTNTPQATGPTTGAPAPTTGVPDTTFSIAEPRPDAVVTGSGFRVSGKSNLRVTDSLWVVYRGITNSNPSFQPQEAPCSISTDGSFSCPRQYVGGPKDGKNRFELFFLVADQDATQEFKDYAASDPEARGYPGLDALPAGVRQVGTVEVRRA
ncbi:MAG: hypothetical protein ACRDSR_26765 [Pseudonocardiaceae bacterium]